MRALLTAALVLATVAGAAQPAVAHDPPAVDGPTGLLCGWSHLPNPTGDGSGAQTATVDGGPLLLVDQHNQVRRGTLTCELLVVGGYGTTVSASGLGIVVLPPTPVSYYAPAGSAVYQCTSFAYVGEEPIYYHWDEVDGGHWTTDPAYECSLSVGIGTDRAAR